MDGGDFALSAGAAKEFVQYLIACLTSGYNRPRNEAFFIIFGLSNIQDF